MIDPWNGKFDFYSDSNHGDPVLDDCKFMSRGDYYLGDSLIHWTFQMQWTPTHSSVESELIGEIGFRRDLLSNFGESILIGKIGGLLLSITAAQRTRTQYAD